MNDLTFLSPARISAARFRRVLDGYQSPAAPDAEHLYQLLVQAGLDPAVALAFFVHESSCGTAGKARVTKNWGNLRRSQGRAIGTYQGFAAYALWSDSLLDWCALLKGRYIARGLDTIGKAIPVYAPSSDGNAPARYTQIVCDLVAAWMASDQPHATHRVLGNGTRIRREPNTQSAIVGKLNAGTLVTVDYVMALGEAVQAGDRRWARLATADERYIYLPLLEAL